MSLDDDKLIRAGVYFDSSFEGLDKNIYFSGFSYDDNAMVFEDGGVSKYLNCDGRVEEDLFGFKEGRFLLAIKNERELKVKSDAQGSELVFYYYDGSHWAVSNSFLFLVKKLFSAGLKLTRCDYVKKSFNIDYSISEQLSSNDTLFSEIKLLPLGSFLKVNLNPSFLTVVSDDDSVESVEKSYEDALVRGLTLAVKASSAMLECFGKHCSIDITGGYDSRIVFGVVKSAANILGRDLSSLNFCSNKSMEDDYRIASSLSRVYKFSITNKRASERSRDESLKYEIWKCFNLGVYTPIYVPMNDRPVRWVHFHGGGGENLRMNDFGDIRVILKNLKKINKEEDVSGLAKVVSKGFSELGLDVGDKGSMRAFYRNFRSRIHFGRASFSSLSGYICSPLQNSYLSQAVSLLNEEEISNRKVIKDALLALDSSLLSHEFDSSWKSDFGDVCEVSEKFHNIEFSSEKLDVFAGDEPSEVNSSNSYNGASFNDLLISDLQKICYGDERDVVASQCIEDIKSGKRVTFIGKKATKLLHDLYLA